MTNVWDARAESYRTSPEHVAGADLDLLVEWAGPGAGVDALDVGTGGGHVARRLEERGCRVVSCDPSPGMKPTVVCWADDLPFADGSFDVVTCRIAAHHFRRIREAVTELARVTRDRVVVEDTLYATEAVEEAERLRDPTHVRSYSEDEWRTLLEDAGLAVEEVGFVDKRHALGPWLARTGCAGAEADRVRALLADRIDDGCYVDTKIVLRARRRP